MEKLTLICLDVLGNHMLAKNDCPALSDMAMRDIKATVPYLPEVQKPHFGQDCRFRSMG